MWLFCLIFWFWSALHPQNQNKMRRSSIQFLSNLCFYFFIIAAQIKTMVNQLGTKQDTSELQDRLQQIQHYTNQLAKETNRHLKELGSVPLRQQRIQRDRLMNDFSAALNNFQAVQRRAAEKERESIARARAGSCLSNEDRFRDEKLVSFDNQEDLGPITTQTEEMAITEEDLELIKERETNIRQLEVSICLLLLDIQFIYQPVGPFTYIRFRTARNGTERFQSRADRVCIRIAVLNVGGTAPQGAFRGRQGALADIFTKGGYRDSFGGRLVEGKLYTLQSQQYQFKL
uniref:Syntaxin N-terminal domain-containing protein n=1 Tax=Poecilia mexicana TaxID=48701 RepID=A0A3B3WG77_9TELE